MEPSLNQIKRAERRHRKYELQKEKEWHKQQVALLDLLDPPKERNKTMGRSRKPRRRGRQMKKLRTQPEDMDCEGKEKMTLDQLPEPDSLPRTKARSRQLLDYVGGLKGRAFMSYAQTDWDAYHGIEGQLLVQQRNASKVSRKNEAKREARIFQELRLAKKTERRDKRRAKRLAHRKTRREAAVTIQRTYRRHLNAKDVHP